MPTMSNVVGNGAANKKGSEIHGGLAMRVSCRKTLRQMRLTQPEFVL